MDDQALQEEQRTEDTPKQISHDAADVQKDGKELPAAMMDVNSQVEESLESKENAEKKYFECSSCKLREEYEFFGTQPPFNKRYKLNEASYLMEDPFQPPRQGEFIILGAHCKECNKAMCKHPQCSFYYDGTYCVECARNKRYSFPSAVQDKLNKVGF